MTCSTLAVVVVWCNGSTSEFDSDSESSILSTTTKIYIIYDGDIGVKVASLIVIEKDRVQISDVTPNNAVVV